MKIRHFKSGLILILIGYLLLLFGMLAPFISLPVLIGGGLVLCGEAFSLLSIVFLGKEGFQFGG